MLAQLNNPFKADFKIKLFLFTVFYFLIHIPFIFNGYGVEEDSWGLVVNVFDMKNSGGYVASRLPGHPVHEYLLYYFFPPSPIVYNLISCISACIAVIFCALFFKNINVTKPLLAAIALAFCPVFFISGTYTIDYTLSFALLITSWYFITEKKIILASIFLALSIGSRITNCAILLPMLLFIGISKENKKDLLKLIAFSILFSILIYIPVFKKYGIYFFDYSDQFPYPNLPKLIYKSTIGVLGLTALVAFLIASIQFRNYKKAPLYVWCSILLCVLAYLRLPQKSAYLIPMIPFIIIYAGKVFSDKAFVYFCFSMIVSGWIFGVNLIDKTRGSEESSYFSIQIAGQKISINPIVGNIIADYRKREIKNNYVMNVLSKTDTIYSKTAIISGWWYNQLLIENNNKRKKSNIEYLFYCSKDSLEKLKKMNYSILYLEEQNIYNDLFYKINCTNLYAKPLD